LCHRTLMGMNPSRSTGWSRPASAARGFRFDVPSYTRIGKEMEALAERLDVLDGPRERAAEAVRVDALDLAAVTASRLRTIMKMGVTAIVTAVLALFMFLRTQPLVTPGIPEAGHRLDDIRRRGFLTCGVWPMVAGFSERDSATGYAGLDVDICRALSAAIFGTPAKVTFVEAPSVQSFLQSNNIDVVSRRLTWELQREGSLGLLFGPVMFYDGQGFLVPRRLGIASTQHLAGRSICVEPQSRSEVTLRLYFNSRGLDLKMVPLDSTDDLGLSFASGRCEAYTADVSLLGDIRHKLAGGGDFTILAEQISKEPLAQIVRKGDDHFFDVLRWTVFAAIEAEELGVTSRNVDAMLSSSDLEVKRLLGVIAGNGSALGLDEKWAYNVIKTVGNYGEMFDRNIGARSTIKMERGLNRLWNAGGLMYAPPLR
jgi:general L-amino acid transport system substrate-binding protein